MLSQKWERTSWGTEKNAPHHWYEVEVVNGFVDRPHEQDREALVKLIAGKLDCL